MGAHWFVEYVVTMKTQDGGIHDFSFQGRRALEFLCGEWGLQGSQRKGVFTINEKLALRFKPGDKYDLIVWARFKEIEGTKTLGTPKIHVICFRPTGEKRWPVPLPEPAVQHLGSRSLLSMYKLTPRSLPTRKPPRLENDDHNCCGLNAMLQVIASDPELLENLITNLTPGTPGILAVEGGDKVLTVLKDMAAARAPLPSSLREAYLFLKSKCSSEAQADTQSDVRDLWGVLAGIAKPEKCKFIYRVAGPCPRCHTNVVTREEELFSVPVTAVHGDLKEIIETRCQVAGTTAYLDCEICKERVAPQERIPREAQFEVGDHIVFTVNVAQRIETQSSTAKPGAAASSSKRQKTIPQPQQTSGLHTFNMPIELKFGKKKFTVMGGVEFIPGHYVGWTKNAACWWRCDDTAITSEPQPPISSYLMLVCRVDQ